MLFAYMAGGEGVGVRGFKIFCHRGSECFLLALCVFVCLMGGQLQYLSLREKITDPLLLINDGPYNKKPLGSLRRLSFLRYYLFMFNYDISYGVGII